MPRNIPFTDYVCQHIQRFDLRETNLYVILPTLRLQRALRKKIILQAQNEGRLPCWLPRFESIDRLLFQWAGLRKALPLELQIHLYQSYREIYRQDQETARSFDLFREWGKMLVADFNRIDNQLAPAREIFSYMAEDKRLSSWHLDLGSSKQGSLQSQYIAFYQKLEHIYHDFTQRLLANGCAYPGLAGRTACQNLPRLIAHGLDENDFFLFAGLNALTGAEKETIKTLIRAGKADILWNADRYYLDDPSQEAGHFLREYRQDPDLNRHFQEEDIADSIKSLPVEVLECPQDTGQAKTVADILRSAPPSPRNRTLIVLNNEQLFAPLMNSLPQGLEYNASLASPLSGTFSGSLFTTLLKARELLFQNPGQGLPAGFALSLLRNPLFTCLSGLKEDTQAKETRKSSKTIAQPDPENCKADEIISWIVAGHRSHFSKKGFRALFPASNPATDLLCRFVFPDPESPAAFPSGLTDPAQVSDSFRPPMTGEAAPATLTAPLSQLSSLAKKILEIDRSRAAQTDLFQKTLPGEKLNPFEENFLQSLATSLDEQIEALENISGEGPGPLSILQLLKETLSGIDLNYTGDPDASLHIMGMLETRGMDFDHVILLSMNEGYLPAPASEESFLLHSVKSHYRIPTETEQTAMQAHHFYSLIQNCKKASLLYLGSKTGKPLEKSRFILQLEHELPANIRSYGQESPSAAFRPGLFHPAYQGRSLRVPKSEALLKTLRHFLNNPYTIVSFSSLSTYLHCPLRFYFRYLLKIGEIPDVSGEVDPLTRGNIFHKAMERFCTGQGPDRADKRGRLLQKEDVGFLRRDIEELLRQSLSEVFPGGQYDHGKNHLAYEELKLRMQRYADVLEREACQGELQILECEKNMVSLQQFPRCPPVRLGGFADRIDCYRPAGSAQAFIRIVDYKTGETKKKKKTNIDDWDELKKEDYAHAFQLLMYLYLYANTNPGEKRPLQACICAVKEKGQMKTLGGKITEKLSMPELLEQTRVFLQETVQDMLDPEKDFACTEDENNCQTCAYSELCRRSKPLPGNS